MPVLTVPVGLRQNMSSYYRTYSPDSTLGSFAFGPYETRHVSDSENIEKISYREQVSNGLEHELDHLFLLICKTELSVLVIVGFDCFPCGMSLSFSLQD